MELAHRLQDSSHPPGYVPDAGPSALYANCMRTTFTWKATVGREM